MLTARRRSLHKNRLPQAVYYAVFRAISSSRISRTGSGLISQPEVPLRGRRGGSQCNSGLGTGECYSAPRTVSAFSRCRVFSPHAMKPAPMPYMKSERNWPADQEPTDHAGSGSRNISPIIRTVA